MIRVENLRKHFGGLKAVDGIPIEIASGSITGLIGPNGAGKTTLFNTIAGLYAPSAGGGCRWRYHDDAVRYRHIVGNGSSDTATIGAHDGNHTISGNQAFGSTGCLCGIDTAT